MSGARPKKRKAPPPPVPVSAAATAPPLETVAVNVTDTEAQSNTAPLPRGGETTTPDVSAEPKPEDQAVSVTEETTEPRVSGTSSPEDVVIRVRGSADVQAEGEQRISEGVAPLAQGEDTAAYDGDSTGDVSRQSDDARPEVGEQQEVPSLEAAVLAVGQVESNNEVTSTSDSNTSEGQVSSDAGVPTKQMTGSEEEPPSTVADETGNHDSENVQRTIINGESISDSIELQNAKQKEIVERTLAVAASEEELSVKSPIVLTLTVQVNKEATEPVSEGSVVAQEVTSSPKKEEDGHQLVIESQPGEQVPCPTSSQLQTAIASEQSTKEDREGSAADNEKSVAPQEEPRKSALETFREEYLAEHYKRCLPVLQITESDLADDKDESRSLQKKEDTMLNKLPGALPVLHISEEDLRDPPETKTNDDRGTSTDDSKTAEMGEHDSSVQKTTSRMSMDCGERPCKESPKPPTRYSSGQELNSKIYFRVLPPLDRGAGTPQLKTFASPNSPPGRKVKPEPSVRNGVAATHQNDVRTNVPGDVSPPRTKSPLPTPRRRHQQIPTPVSDM